MPSPSSLLLVSHSPRRGRGRGPERGVPHKCPGCPQGLTLVLQYILLLTSTVLIPTPYPRPVRARRPEAAEKGPQTRCSGRARSPLHRRWEQFAVEQELLFSLAHLAGQLAPAPGARYNDVGRSITVCGSGRWGQGWVGHGRDGQGWDWQ